MTVSYLPLFAVLNTLLFGNPRIPRIDENGFETLVNRAVNVWGSGGAHATYFKKVDEIVVEIFNRPLALQPRGICDMGCGDGTLLAHLYSVVKTRTARGRDLDRHPLIIVGADFNKVARRASKQTLRRSGVPVFHVIHGDINRPAQLAGDLEELGHDVHDLLRETGANVWRRVRPLLARGYASLYCADVPCRLPVGSSVSIHCGKRSSKRGRSDE